MPSVEIAPDIFWVGVNDRTTDLFEGLWPISNEGVSYNSYLIVDEKKVLIDLAKAMKTDDFFAQIAGIVDPRTIDYLVVNHPEPDHSGILRVLKQIAPQMKVLCSSKAVDMLSAFYNIDDGFQVVQDGDTLSTGRHALRFVSTPFVHWPETMMTYDSADGVLFSCDGFGGYGALRGGIFDDECSDPHFYEQESLRYFVNIVARYTGPVLKAIEKLAGVEVKTIAPSHGLVWRRNPGRIVELYRKWCEYASGPGEAGITLIYGSMYGNTEALMNAVAQGVASAEVPMEIFDASRTHASYILPSLWTKRGVLIGAPTYEASLFPPVADVLRLAGAKAIRSRKAGWFGSFAWSGGALRDLQKIIEPLKWTLDDTLEIKGGPTDADLKRARIFGADFARKLG